MRRHRFPSYAPEALERKLHPSGVASISVAAEVFIPNTQYVAIPDPSATSSLDVIAPGSMPAPQFATATTLEEPPPPGPTSPGSPEPSPEDGTDPEPPDGNGDPPIGYPSTPVGPGLPALA